MALGNRLSSAIRIATRFPGFVTNKREAPIASPLADRRNSEIMPSIKASSISRFLLIILLICFAGQVRASAASFTVNTLLDNEANGCSAGNCTLREAVTEANNSAGDDTIVFHTSLTGVVGLTTFLSITTNITITGPGPRSLTIRCTANRVFIVSGAGVTANISGLTITGNNLGGGIGNSGGSTLTLSDAAIVNNRAGVGGGVSTRNGAITN